MILHDSECNDNNNIARSCPFGVNLFRELSWKVFDNNLPESASEEYIHDDQYIMMQYLIDHCISDGVVFLVTP